MADVPGTAGPQTGAARPAPGLRSAGLQRAPAPTEFVVAAIVMTMSSAFGQTYFIAVFAPWLKADLALSDGGFGTLYSLGTIASACVLMWGGKIADRFRIRGLAVLALLALAAMCMGMSQVRSPWLLLPILFGLRLFGQGAMGHLALTGVGRWYIKRRGRMMSLAVLGFPVSEAFMPATAVALMAAIGWRQTWLVGAFVLCAVSVPLTLALLRREPRHAHTETGGEAEGTGQKQWTRGEVLRRPEFFAALVAVVAPSFVMTGIFFHQAYLVDDKGWTLSWFAGWFPVYASVSVVTALSTGWLIDRFGSIRLLPFFLLPMAGAVTVLALSASPWSVPVFMALGALTNGGASTLLGALWAELFGTRHLGAIRSVAFAAQVIASALAPGLMGVLLDLGAPLALQYLAMVAYALAAAACLGVLMPRLRRLARF